MEDSTRVQWQEIITKVDEYLWDPIELYIVYDLFFSSFPRKNEKKILK